MKTVTQELKVMWGQPSEITESNNHLMVNTVAFLTSALALAKLLSLHTV